MGAKKIEAKRKEYATMVEDLSKIVGVIEKLTPSLQKYQDIGKEISSRLENLNNKMGELVPVIEKIDTHGVKEFEQYKAHLLDICMKRKFEARLLPTGLLKTVVEKKKKEVARDLNDWMDKLATALPKEFKKGMSFKDYGLGRIYELTSDAEKAKNENLKGDEALIYKVDIYSVPTDDNPAKKIGSTIMSKADMLKGGKLKYMNI